MKDTSKEGCTPKNPRSNELGDEAQVDLLRDSRTDQTEQLQGGHIFQEPFRNASRAMLLGARNSPWRRDDVTSPIQQEAVGRSNELRMRGRVEGERGSKLAGAGPQGEKGGTKEGLGEKPKGIRSEGRPQQGAKPMEVYGFVGSIAAVLAFWLYMAWAYIPEPWLHAIGITYYPSKYWAVALPAYFGMAILAGLLAYAGLNHLATPSPQSLCTMFDGHSRLPTEHPFASAHHHPHQRPIPPICDLPLTHVNDLLYGHDSNAFVEARTVVEQGLASREGKDGASIQTIPFDVPISQSKDSDVSAGEGEEPGGYASGMELWRQFFGRDDYEVGDHEGARPMVDQGRVKESDETSRLGHSKSWNGRNFQAARQLC